MNLIDVLLLQGDIECMFTVALKSETTIDELFEILIAKRYVGSEKKNYMIRVFHNPIPSKYILKSEDYVSITTLKSGNNPDVYVDGSVCLVEDEKDKDRDIIVVHCAIRKDDYDFFIELMESLSIVVNVDSYNTEEEFKKMKKLYVDNKPVRTPFVNGEKIPGGDIKNISLNHGDVITYKYIKR
jgi:hypothetical protein